MDNKQKFEMFLENLKGNGQDALIESVKKGFQVCMEGQWSKSMTAGREWNEKEANWRKQHGYCMKCEGETQLGDDGKCPKCDKTQSSSKMESVEETSEEEKRDLEKYWDEKNVESYNFPDCPHEKINPTYDLAVSMNTDIFRNVENDSEREIAINYWPRFGSDDRYFFMKNLCPKCIAHNITTSWM